MVKENIAPATVLTLFYELLWGAGQAELGFKRRLNYGLING